MLKEITSSKAPEAIGPYSHGMKFGKMIITSGQIPVNPQTHEMVTEIREATLTVLNNLLAVVEAGGGNRNTIAKVDVFVKSLDDFDDINEVYTEFFGDHKPARVLTQAGEVPAGALLEAAAIAFAAD